MFKKYFSISYMYNTKSDHFRPKNKAEHLWKFETKCKIIKWKPTASLYMKNEAIGRL